MELTQWHGEIDFRLDRVPQALLRGLTISEHLQEPLSIFKPVLALTLTHTDTKKVLVAVRDGDANLTHPDVLSSPTARIRGVPEATVMSLPTGPARSGEVPSWLLDQINRIMSVKLDASFSVAPGLIKYLASWQGHSIIGTDSSGGAVSEALSMINVNVELPGVLARRIPRCSASYSVMRWISPAQHRAMVDSGDPAAGGVSLDGPVPIVYGLCTLSTAAMLDAISGALVS